MGRVKHVARGRGEVRQGEVIGQARQEKHGPPTRQGCRSTYTYKWTSFSYHDGLVAGRDNLYFPLAWRQRWRTRGTW